MVAAAVAGRSVAVTVPSTETMVEWSPPLVPYGGCSKDGVEEPSVGYLQQGLARSNGGWM
jgi:hypothetical protein